MTSTFLVLGATGDLAGRLLLPAIAGMRAAGALDPDVALLAAAREGWTDAEFAAHVGDRLAAAMRYHRADVTDPADVAALVDRAAGGPLMVYLALPTQLLLGAVRALQAAGLPAGSRIAVEKPFGQDAASARELNAALAGADAERVDVYRIDHALAMTAVRDLPRAAADWDGEHVAQVELLWEETLALESRAAFYDRAGALRDVVQNHLLQLLCTVAAGSPGVPAPADAAGRAAVLRSVRPLTRADVRATRRARYTAGRLSDGRAVPDYAAEDGVDAARTTETFAEVTLELDSPRWRGTRFVLRTGKALDRQRRGVLVHSRGGEGTAWFDVDDPLVPAEPAAYQRIVADLLGGGSAFAVGADEVELAWDLLAPVQQAWSADAVPLLEYPAGSPGPG